MTPVPPHPREHYKPQRLGYDDGDETALGQLRVVIGDTEEALDEPTVSGL